MDTACCSCTAFTSGTVTGLARGGLHFLGEEPAAPFSQAFLIRIFAP